MNNLWWLLFLLGCLRSATGTDVEKGTSAIETEVGKGGCTCAVFEASGNQPLMGHGFPIDVSCDEEGVKNCLELCVALAKSAKEKAPTMICENLQRHVENLKIRLYAKSCGADGWNFTGLESTEGICCHDGKVTPCDAASTPN